MFRSNNYADSPLILNNHVSVHVPPSQLDDPGNLHSNNHRTGDEDGLLSSAAMRRIDESIAMSIRRQMGQISISVPNSPEKPIPPLER